MDNQIPDSERVRSAWAAEAVAKQAARVASLPNQVVRVYRGKHMERDFQHDAANMAKHGWHVQSQAYGGSRGPGLLKIFLWGIFAFGGRRRASELTVVYVR